MIFEAGGKFDQAAQSFEEFGDLERAYYCFERAGDLESSSRLRSKKSTAKFQSSSAPSRFILGEDSQLSEIQQNFGTHQLDQGAPHRGQSPSNSNFQVSHIDEMTAKNEPGEESKPSAAYSTLPASELSHFKLYIDEDDLPTAEVSGAPIGNENRGRNLSANAFLANATEKTEQFDSGGVLIPGFSKEESRYLVATHKNFFNCSIFVDLNRDECELIWNAGEVVELESNVVLYDGLSNLEGMYVILEGKFSCTKINESKPSGTISVSDSFGELSVLAEYQTPIQLCSLTNSKVWYCSSSKFEQALFSNGNISTKIYKYYLSKLLTRLTQHAKAG